MANNIKKIFEALPHVNEVWVTDDGNFHLHEDNGGKKVSRDNSEKEVIEEDTIKKTEKEE
jgi:hypothetical protein